MSRYAEGTSVPIERSRAEIEAAIRKYGATSFSSGNAEDMTGREIAYVAFALSRGKSENPWMVKFDLEMPRRDEPEIARKRTGTNTSKARPPAEAQKVYEAECRRRWRALALCIRAKLEAVETGITTAETEFMPHVVMPDGRSFADHAIPAIRATYETGQLPQLNLPLLPPPPASRKP